MRIPILTYQPLCIGGNEYADNHLRALATDLRVVSEEGFRILPLREVIDVWQRGGDLQKVVAFCVEDGSDFDYVDLNHPTAGPQRSVLNALRDFSVENPDAQPALHVTSFVIASPQARSELDQACMVGHGWWNDHWWKEAVASGLMHIGNHSWDHNHEALSSGISLPIPRGTFATIDDEARADHEIRQAADFLRIRAPNPGLALFSYPYGEANPFLTKSYLPRYSGQLGLRAAFTDEFGFLEEHTPTWAVPRLMFGRDWRSPDRLRELLRQAEVRVATVAPGHHAIQDPEDVKRFEMVPGVLFDWLEPHGGLSGKEMLDFGCGQGVSALALATRYGARRVVGVDIGPDPLKCPDFARSQLGLRRLPDNLRLHRVEAGTLHDASDRFDLVYSWSVFEHVDQRLVGQTLEMLRDCLKPSGRLFIQIAPLYYSAEGSHLFHRFDEPWAHLSLQHDVLYARLRERVADEAELRVLWGTYETLNRMTVPELRRAVRSAGFEIDRELAMKDERPIPPGLLEVYAEEALRTFQVVLLARPA